MSPEIRLTPPRRANRRMAGFVIPWMLSRKIFLWRLAPPFPSPFPPFPRPDMMKLVKSAARAGPIRMRVADALSLEWRALGLLPRSPSDVWWRHLSQPIRRHFLIHVVNKLRLAPSFWKKFCTLILTGISPVCPFDFIFFAKPHDRGLTTFFTNFVVSAQS